MKNNNQLNFHRTMISKPGELLYLTRLNYIQPFTKEPILASALIDQGSGFTGILDRNTSEMDAALILVRDWARPSFRNYKLRLKEIVSTNHMDTDSNANNFYDYLSRKGLTYTIREIPPLDQCLLDRTINALCDLLNDPRPYAQDSSSYAQAIIPHRCIDLYNDTYTLSAPWPQKSPREILNDLSTRKW